MQARDRQLYHLRHTRDYEALGIPIGASKAEARKAYRDLAKVRLRQPAGLRALQSARLPFP